MDKRSKIMLMCAVLAVATAIVAVQTGVSDLTEGEPASPSATISDNIYVRMGDDILFQRTITLTGATFNQITGWPDLTDIFSDLSGRGLQVKLEGVVNSGDTSMTLTFKGKDEGPDSFTKTIGITIPADKTSAGIPIITHCTYLLREKYDVQIVSEPEHIYDALSVTAEMTYGLHRVTLSGNMTVPGGQAVISTWTELDLGGNELKIGGDAISIVSNGKDLIIKNGTLIQESAGKSILTLDKTAVSDDAELTIINVTLRGTSDVTAVQYIGDAGFGKLVVSGGTSPSRVEDCATAFKGFKGYELYDLEVVVNNPGMQTRLTTDSDKTIGEFLGKGWMISYYDPATSTMRYSDESDTKGAGTAYAVQGSPMVFREGKFEIYLPYRSGYAVETVDGYYLRVAERWSYRFTVTPEPNYTLVSVKVNGTAIEPSDSGVYEILNIQEDKDVTVTVKPSKPNAAFEATGPDTGKLSRVSSGMAYSTDGSAWTDITGTDMTLTGLSACTLSIKVKGNEFDVIDSDIQGIVVTKPDPPAGVTGVSYYKSAGVNSQINGMEFGMEYRPSDGSWEKRSSNLVDVPVGTYEVRYFADRTKLASDVVTVKIQSPTATSIRIATPPSKTSFISQEPFNRTGMVVMADYPDDTSWPVTEYTVKAQHGTSVVLSYRDTYVTVIVKAEDGIELKAEQPVSVAKLVSMEIADPPKRTEYLVGQSFDTNGMYVDLVFSNGYKERQYPGGMDISGPLAVTDTKITFSAKREDVIVTCTQSITVAPAELVRIEIATPPDKTVYAFGEKFDSTGMVVRAFYAGGFEANVKEYVAFIPSGATGDTKAIISYELGAEKKYAYQDVTVLSGHTVKFDANGGGGSMEEQTAPAGTYTLPACGFTAPGGKVFDAWSFSATGPAISGSSIDLTGDVTLYALWKDQPVVRVLSGISVAPQPSKTSYIAGEAFDGTGMVVTATYSDGTSAAVTGYSVSPSGALTTSVSFVTISYTEGGVTKQVTLAVTVSAAPTPAPTPTPTPIPTPTPAPTPTPDPGKTEVLPDGTEVTTKTDSGKTDIGIASKDGSVKTEAVRTEKPDGTADVEIRTVVTPTASVDDALTAAISQMDIASSKLAGDTTRTVTVNLTGPTVEVGLSPSTMADVAASGATVEFTGSAGSISVSPEVSKALGSRTGDIALSVGDADKSTLNEAQRKIVGDHAVFDLKVSEAGKTFSELGGFVTVTLPYTLKAGEDPDKVRVYHVDDDGVLREYVTKYDAATGTVSFSTDHFSYWMVGVVEGSPEPTPGGPSGDNALMYIVAAIAVVALIIGLYVFRIRANRSRTNRGATRDLTVPPGTGSPSGRMGDFLICTSLQICRV